MSNEFEETYSEPTPPEKPKPTRKAAGGGGSRRPPKQPAKRSQPPARRDLTPQLPWLLAGVAVLVAAALGIYFGVIRSTSPTTTVKGNATSNDHYRVAYPKDWKVTSPNAVAPGQHAFAAFKQEKGHGVVVMRLEGKVTNLDGSYLHSLERQLAKGATDYKFVGAHMIDIKAGHALDVTYDKTKLHEVRNVVVLPTGSISVVIATVATLGDKKTTQEIDDIVSSLQLTK